MFFKVALKISWKIVKGQTLKPASSDWCMHAMSLETKLSAKQCLVGRDAHCVHWQGKQVVSIVLKCFVAWCRTHNLHTAMSLFDACMYVGWQRGVLFSSYQCVEFSSNELQHGYLLHCIAMHKLDYCTLVLKIALKMSCVIHLRLKQLSDCTAPSSMFLKVHTLSNR